MRYTLVQERTLQLLLEIDRICRQKEIKYSLSEKTALMALNKGKFRDNDYMLEIMMTPANYNSFKAVVKENAAEDRILEDMSTNSQMDGFTAIYADRNTTMIDFIRGGQYKAKGIYVKIRILRPNKNYGKLFQIFERVSATNNVRNLRYAAKYSKGKRKLAFMGFAVIRKFLCSGGFAEKQFSRILSGADIKKDGQTAFATRLDLRAVRKYPKGLFSSYTYVEFEGHDFMIAGNRAELRRNLKSDNVKPMNIVYNVGRHWEISDTYMPYEVFLKTAESAGYSLSQMQKDADNYCTYRAYVATPLERKAASDWRYINRSFDRFDMWEKYEPKRRELIKAHLDGHDDVVRKAFREFDERVSYYSRFNMGFAFDKELFDVYCESMDRPDKAVFVNKLKSIMPPEFEENMGEYLGRQGAIHPLIKREEDEKTVMKTDPLIKLEAMAAEEKE